MSIAAEQTDFEKTTGRDIVPLSKTPSHIVGLDQILRGGFPEGRTTLIEGGPGTGKSILAMEFLYREALVGNAGVFVAFEERAGAVRRNALTLGWDLEELEKDGKLAIIEAQLNPDALVSGEFNIKALLAIIEGKARSLNARNIVFDALDVLLRFFDNPSRERMEIYSLHDWIIDRQMTTILTVKVSGESHVLARYEFLEFMADCVIRLTQKLGEWVSTRELQVIKYRGSDFGRNAYPIVIHAGGVAVIPISEYSLQHKPLGAHVPTGNTQLDRILGGGIRRGSSVLIAGASGTGKTTLAATFVKAAAERGERILYLGFEESEEAMVGSMLSPGIDLRPQLKGGLIRVITAMPESTGTEVHLMRAFTMIEELKPDHVVVDAVSSFERMGSSRASFEFAMRLVNQCKDRGITALLINQSGSETNSSISISGMGISSMIDSILWLRFVDVGNKLLRVLIVIKSRGSRHSNQYHEYRITDQGIEFLDEPLPFKVEAKI